ncbi:hypothetical protein LJC55_01455 [Eubacteriales bacterium OttesenSCG-928-N14]|nr:hypothetical protein [Eubacteriales bacterium OttesenSCG-928-N14]
MKKNIAVRVAVLMFICPLVGCSQSSDVPKRTPKASYQTEPLREIEPDPWLGFESAQMISAQKEGEYIIYVTPEGILRSKPDGSEKKLILEGAFAMVLAGKDGFYFASVSGHQYESIGYADFEGNIVVERAWNSIEGVRAYGKVAPEQQIQHPHGFYLMHGKMYVMGFTFDDTTAICYFSEDLSQIDYLETAITFEFPSEGKYTIRVIRDSHIYYFYTHDDGSREYYRVSVQDNGFGPIESLGMRNDGITQIHYANEEYAIVSIEDNVCLRVDFATQERKVLFEKSINSDNTRICVNDTQIFFALESSASIYDVYRINHDGSGRELLAENMKHFGCMFLVGDYLYNPLRTAVDFKDESGKTQIMYQLWAVNVLSGESFIVDESEKKMPLEI